MKRLYRTLVRICSKCGHDMFPDGPGACKNCGNK